MIYDRGSPKDFDRWQSWGNNAGPTRTCFLLQAQRVVRVRPERLPGAGGRCSSRVRRWRIRSITRGARPACSGVKFTTTSRPVRPGSDRRNSRFTTAARQHLKSILAAGAGTAQPHRADGCARRAGAVRGDRAVGVHTQGRRAGSARAEREVVIACGVYNSPHLLMLSGVGEADHLRAHGIAPVADLKGVGLNLRITSRSPSRSRRPVRSRSTGISTTRSRACARGSTTCSGAAGRLRDRRSRPCRSSTRRLPIAMIPTSSSRS